MRSFFLALGWLSAIGSFFDGAIFAFVAWLAATGAEPWTMTVDAHLREHLSAVYWIKDVAYALLPDGLVDWIFGLPAAVYYPARTAISILIGALAFAEARKRGRTDAS